MNLFGRFLFGTLFLTLITEALTDAAADPEALDKVTLNVNVKDEDKKGNNANGVYDKKKTKYADYDTNKGENEDGDTNKGENEDGDTENSESNDYDSAIIPIFVSQKIGNEIKPDRKWGHWGHWSMWSRCSVTCGYGRQKRYRQCLSNYPHGGSPGWGKPQCTGSDTETRSCFNRPCDHLHWCPWSHWSCDVTCGRGTSTKHRKCADHCEWRERGGREKRQIETETDSKSENGEESGYWPEPEPEPEPQTCQGPKELHKPCYKPPCPVYKHWCPWQQWSQCSVTCGTGTRERHRTCAEYCPDKPDWREKGGREKRETEPETESNSENEQESGSCPFCECPGSSWEMGKCYQQPCETTTTWRTTTWRHPTTTWNEPPVPTWQPDLCTCINPWEGTDKWAQGDWTQLCPARGMCFVGCGHGCRDQEGSTAGTPARCESRAACDEYYKNDLGRETGKKAEGNEVYTIE